MPEAINVANCREKIASGRIFTLLNRWKMDSSFIASCFSETSRTIRPRWRSCSVTIAFEVASSSPREGTPARSTALNAKLATSPSSSGDGHRRLGHPGPGAEETLQLLGDGRPLLGHLRADLAHPHELREVGVHGLHPHGAGRLDRRVDLVGLPLANQVAHGRRGHQD